jgi:DnaJ-class molecular chaperone
LWRRQLAVPRRRTRAKYQQVICWTCNGTGERIVFAMRQGERIPTTETRSCLRCRGHRQVRVRAVIDTATGEVLNDGRLRRA